jgi:hypothetical protein
MVPSAGCWPRLCQSCFPQGGLFGNAKRHRGHSVEQLLLEELGYLSAELPFAAGPIFPNGRGRAADFPQGRSGVSVLEFVALELALSGRVITDMALLLGFVLGRGIVFRGFWVMGWRT